MTTTTPTPRFVLPAHFINAAAEAQVIPEAQPTPRVATAPKRSRKSSGTHSAPPSVEIMEELRTLLTGLHPDDPHPDRRWIRVLRGIFNSTRGHSDGFALADKWSSKGKAYTGPAGVMKFWKRLKLNHPNPVTIRTLRWMVDQKSL